MNFTSVLSFCLLLLLQSTTAQWTSNVADGVNGLSQAGAEMSAGYDASVDPDKIYLITADCEIITFGIAAKSFSSPATGISDSCQRGGVILSSIFYVQSGNDYLNIYNLATNSWSTSATYLENVASGQSCLAGSGNKLYVLGGLGSAGAAFKDTQIYDIAGNSWSAGKDMDTARRLLACAVANDQLFAIGGWTGLAKLDTVEYISISDVASAASSWTVMTNGNTFAVPKEYLSAVVQQGFIYIFGDYSTDVYVIIPGPNPVLSASPNPLSYADGGGAPVSADNILYLFGGYDADKGYEETTKWQYTTSETTTTTTTSTSSTTTTTKSPNSGKACSRFGASKNYEIIGTPCYVYGDPHYTMWNGDKHDFQGQPLTGKNTYYYVTPCAGVTKTDMPFSVLATHYNWGDRIVTGVDYLTLELYDSSGLTYYVYFSSRFRVFSSNPDNAPDAQLNRPTSSSEQLGNDFVVAFHKIRANRKYELTVTIDGDADKLLKFEMEGEADIVEGRYRMHKLWITVPDDYKCFICGLCGDFNTVQYSRTFKNCFGDDEAITTGWSEGNAFAFDVHAWTWERTFRDEYCPITTTRRRLQSNATVSGYVPFLGNFTYIDPCDPIIQPQVISACQSARDDASECCNIIGSDNCDAIQASCEIDVCVAAGTNVSAIATYVEQFFTETLNFTCSIPDVDALFAPENREPSVEISTTTMNDTVAIETTEIKDTATIETTDIKDAMPTATTEMDDTIVISTTTITDRIPIATTKMNDDMLMTTAEMNDTMEFQTTEDDDTNGESTDTAILTKPYWVVMVLFGLLMRNIM